MNNKGSALHVFSFGLFCILLFTLIITPAVLAEETVARLDPATVGKKAVPIDVVVGKETVLKINKHPKDIKQVSLANNEIADIKPLLSFPATKTVEVVIYGKKPGITSLIVWDKEGNKTFFDVIVHRERMVEFERERADAIEQKIKAVAPDSDVRVEFAGDTIVLTGTANNRHMIDKIEKVAMLYASAGCDGISRGESLHPIRTEKTETKAKAAGYVSVNVTQQALQQAEEKKKSEALCVLNLITMPEAQQVLLEVKVAQINKSKMKELGISFLLQGIGGNDGELTFPGLAFTPSGMIGKLDTTETKVLGIGPTGNEIVVDRYLGKSDVWPGITGFDLDVNQPQIGFAHFPSGVVTLIKALQEKGLGKLLAEPNLLVRSGEIGEFHVGTEVPIQVIEGFGADRTASIEYKEVGIILKFTPEVLETGAIRLKINPAEVSSIIRYLSLLGTLVPEIDTRKVITSVDLKEGESLILAGLLSEEMKKNIQKFPVLGDIPIFGALFRSTKDELLEKELVFFITPKLVKPMAPGEKVKLPTDNRPTPEEERQFQWIPMPGAGEGAESNR